MRVLLATDGSHEAEAATECLRTFPLPDPSLVRVLTVATLDHGRPAAFESAETCRRRVRERAATVARGAQDALRARWPEAEARVADGDAREEIVRMAEAWAADLVVLGARGLTPLKRALLGSVSTTVAHHVPCPVLVVRGSRHGVRTIVLGVDGSSDSLAAAAFVRALPLDPRGRVTLVGVVPPPPLAASPELGVGPVFLDDVLARWRADATRVVERVERTFTGRVARTERRLIVGHAADEIVTTASEVGADLIVVGARGLGAIGRLLLGSVSDYVLLHSECPVLVIRGRAGARWADQRPGDDVGARPPART